MKKREIPSRSLRAGGATRNEWEEVNLLVQNMIDNNGTNPFVPSAFRLLDPAAIMFGPPTAQT